MRINIAYACNDVYIIQTGISLISLFENNKDVDEIYIYFIDMGTTEDARNKLKKICIDYGRTLKIIDFEEWKNDLKIDATGRHIASVYAKIFFGRISDIDRIIYIDSDTVIVDSLAQMWETDLGDCWIAGVETISSAKHNIEIGIMPEDVFINDGVVLMDLVAWRQNDAERKCFDYIAKFNGNPPVLSEGTINYVCRDHIYKLNPQYNMMAGLFYFSSQEVENMTKRPFYSEDTLCSSRNSPTIIHYLTGFYNRPWNKNCKHPLKCEYEKYKAMSYWKDEPLREQKLPRRLKQIDILHNLVPTWLFLKIYHLLGRK